MSVAESVVLAVGERIERTGGPRAGLVAWRAIATSATNAHVRGNALLAALRCALRLWDDASLEALTRRWESVGGGEWIASIASLCASMQRAGRASAAVALSLSEVRRRRTAQSLYCYARCLDVARAALATEAFRETVARAEEEGAKEVELAARVRRCTLLARSWRTMNEALEEAARIDLERLAPASRLVVAKVLLRSPSRFTRAATIGALDALVLDGDEAIARRALELVARWIDDVGDAFTALELDRVVALFGRERALRLAPRALPLVRVVARLVLATDDQAFEQALNDAAMLDPALAVLHARAKDILDDRFEPVRELYGSSRDVAPWHERRWTSMLDTVVAIRDNQSSRAAYLLRILAEAEERGEPTPPQVMPVVRIALASDDTELRANGVRWFAARLRAVRPGLPSCGFASMANALERLEMSDLALDARYAAAFYKEPSAREVLVTVLARTGWELARTGDRSRAIESLRKARAMASRRD